MKKALVNAVVSHARNLILLSLILSGSQCGAAPPAHGWYPCYRNGSRVRRIECCASVSQTQRPAHGCQSMEVLEALRELCGSWDPVSGLYTNLLCTSPSDGFPAESCSGTDSCNLNNN